MFCRVFARKKTNVTVRFDFVDQFVAVVAKTFRMTMGQHVQRG